MKEVKKTISAQIRMVFYYRLLPLRYVCWQRFNDPDDTDGDESE